MLELKNVVIRQGDFALRADMRIPATQRTAIIGPSGAGKSTLLMALAGFLELSEGALVWDGHAFTDAPPAKRPFSMLFQDGNLFPHMTVAENVGLGLRPSLRLSLDEKARVAQALKDVGLGEMGARKPAELSGGQQSRAALARVLLQDRPMLLLDEPFSALGPALKDEMLDLVTELCAQTSIGLMMVSHDPSDAKRICDHTIFVAEGTAHAPVPTKAFFDDPPKALKAYLGT